jgi:predicted nucleic acid-binding protein
MTAFLLDTSTIIEFSKRREPTYSQVIAWIRARDTLAACAISVAEFYTGLSVAEAREWDRFVSELTYWPISMEAARYAGQERDRLARQGRAISTTDALIAAVAREHNAVLVTGNDKDFPMADLVLLPLPG